MITPFNNLNLLTWLLRHNEFVPPIQKVVVAGYEPFSQEAFLAFMAERGIELYGLGTSLSYLVVGRKGWEGSQLRKQIALRREKSLRIYSQEMLVTFITSQQDPYESIEILNLFIEDHPALDYIKSNLYDFTSHKVVPRDFDGKGGPSGVWPENGIFRATGRFPFLRRIRLNS